MSNIQQITTVKEGKLQLTEQQRQIITSNLKYFTDGQEVLLDISKYNEAKYKKDKRTEQQNKYYHKLLDIICDYTGEEHLKLHNDLKCMFLAKPWIKEDKEYLVVSSTRDLTLKEFGDYLEKVFKWASEELNLNLPSANYD